ncbi:MAG: hypothetical protein LBQ57_11050 [Spirochaetales bacterium]|jgi:hypothetical protein|nr:hypothetical protein [Spirochaetales bacterium]
MAIQPIDMQVLFSRLNQLGKEQAEQRDGQLHTQLVQGAELVKRAEQQEHSVTGARETEGEDVRHVKDENRRQQQGKKSDAGKKRGEDKEETPRQEVLTEAYLGKKIDISG